MIHNLAEGREVFTSSAFLVTGDRTALVDVGNEFDVVGAVEERVDELDAVVLTHTHYDHVANLESVVDAFDPTVLAYDETFDGVDTELPDGGTVRLGDHDYLALHTPGHKNDHLCLYADSAGVLFAGDLVFANGSFGRTDLDEGDRPTLVDSIERLLDEVGDDFRVMHAGHGPSVDSDPRRDVETALNAAKF